MRLRAPVKADAARIRELVVASGTLEANSLYAYLLVATHFAESSLVAEAEDGELAGFVAAYRPPTRPGVVFVWQVGVAAAFRGAGLGLRLLEALPSLPACRGASYLEATVTPSNEASKRLFRAFARSMAASCEVEPWLDADDFLPEIHEREDLFRIGPFASKGQGT